MTATEVAELPPAVVPAANAARIVALDLSLTATGYATSGGVRGVLSPPKDHDRGLRRVQWILDQIHTLTEHADLVVIEGYAFGAKNQQGMISTHELGGVVRFALWEAGRACTEIPPSCLKLFATGKGNAPKDEVLAAAIRKLEYSGHDHNEADALWLLEMASAHADGRSLTAVQQRALAKIVWPQLQVAER